MKGLNRPYATLFLVCSVDGKISSGDTDELDVDRDWNRIEGVKEGLHQYYELEDRSIFPEQRKSNGQDRYQQKIRYSRSDPGHFYHN